MIKKLRFARVNVKALFILAMIVGVLGVGAVGGHLVRKRVMAKQSLSAGREALARKDWQEACTQLKRYLSQYPDDVDVLEVYARARLTVRPRTQGDVGAAIGAFRRLLRHKPSDGVLFGKLSSLYLNSGDYVNAALICRQRLEGAPDDPTAGLDLATALIGQRLFDEAVPVLDTLIEKHPDEARAYGLRAEAELERNGDEGAKAIAKRILDRGVNANPRNPVAYIERARLAKRIAPEGSEDAVTLAKADLQSADELHSDSPQVVLRLAREWIAVGDWARADAALGRIADVSADVLMRDDLDPDKFTLEWFLAKSYAVRQLGAKEQMAKVAGDGLNRLLGGYRSAFLETAIDLYLATGDWQSAGPLLREYRELVTGVPEGSATGDDVLSWLSARFAFAQDRPYDVIDLITPVVVRNPNSYAAWRLMSQAFIATGQSRRAIRALQECVRLRPTDRTAVMQLV